MGDPVTAAALGTIGSAAIGTKQVAPAQPFIPPSAGPNNLGKDALVQSLLSGKTSAPINPVQDAQQGLPALDPLLAGDQGKIEELPTPERREPGSLLPESSGLSMLDKFFGGIDNTFQSPAKLLGVGLLNQIKPGAGTLGLGLAGLLGAFRK